ARTFRSTHRLRLTRRLIGRREIWHRISSIAPPFVRRLESPAATQVRQRDLRPRLLHPYEHPRRSRQWKRDSRKARHALRSKFRSVERRAHALEAIRSTRPNRAAL